MISSKARRSIALIGRNASPLSASRMGALAALLILTSCSGSGSEGGAGGPGGPGRQVQVGYVVIQASSVPVEQSLPGRVAAFQISEVRPQVSGVVRRRLRALTSPDFDRHSWANGAGTPAARSSPRVRCAA